MINNWSVISRTYLFQWVQIAEFNVGKQKNIQLLEQIMVFCLLKFHTCGFFLKLRTVYVHNI